MLGWTDCPLSQTGEAEVWAHRSRLANQGICKIVSSDLGRCRTTAEHAAKALAELGPNNIQLTASTDWRELHFGDWEGLNPREIAPQNLQDFHADPDQYPPPNGERWSDLQGRVARALQGLAPEPTLVAAHGGSIRAALAILLGWDLRQCWAVDIPYAALLRLSVWETCPRTAQLTGLFRPEDRT